MNSPKIHRPILGLALFAALLTTASTAPHSFTEEQRAWWAVQPIRDPQPPQAHTHPIDAFIERKRSAVKLAQAPPASPAELIRRIHFNLHGLPPTPDQIQTFVRAAKEDSSTATENLVTKLLASPRYGERWAQHWLDVVRYAESDGYREDAFRPGAHLYRDYVIRNFNNDKPYHQFVREQLAADEFAPTDPATLDATGFLRLGIYEWNQRNAEMQRELMLNEITDVTGEAFLALGIGCARCHDHKFDPLLQRDYFALQAFLSSTTWPDHQPRGTPEQLKKHQAQQRSIAATRAEISTLLFPAHRAARSKHVRTFPPNVQEMYWKPAANRTSYEHQISLLVQRQVDREKAKIDPGKALAKDKQKLARYKKLRARLTELEKQHPELPTAFASTDTGTTPAITYMGEGKNRTAINPNYPALLDAQKPNIVKKQRTTGRRTALADWITASDNPLTARIAAHFDATTVPPLISSFSVSPVSIASGSTATLSWEVSNAITSLAIDNGVGDVLPLTTAGTGSTEISPTAGITYTLTASDDTQTQTATASIAVGNSGDFLINEFLAINGGPIADEDGDEEDWIEIKNTGPVPADLAGWFLTDDPEALTKWQFPATAVPAGDFLLVFASGKDRAVAGGEPHTNFKLSGNGEYLALIEPDGTTIHHEFAPAYPAQVAAISYGIAPGTADTGYFRNPTPLGENDAFAITAFVEEPVTASVTRGFFEAPFDVTLTTAAEGADIYFTTDASEPTPTNGTLYTTPITVTTTTTLRAGVFRASEAPLKITTQTYLFLDDVIAQPSNPPGYPNVWQPTLPADYEMDSDTSIGTPAEIKTALRDLPTLSLVMEIDDWFNNNTNPAVGGIYSNSTIARGSAWERKVSAEFFDFPHGQEIQVDAGMRIFGNASRATSRKKHNMRLVFRSAYGPSRLEFPLFGGDDEPDVVNSYLMRGQNGDSWFHPTANQRTEALYLRDQLARDLQSEMGRPSTKQDHVHLYINGLYWGVFNTIERIEDDSMAQMFGGSEEDWDVIKSSRNPGMEAVDGSTDPWTTVVNLANAGVTDPDDYAAIQEYVDLPSMIDWLLVNFYNGNADWDDNNWQAGRLRAPGETFKFFTWDSERTMLGNTANSITKNFNGRATGVHNDLRANPEYRLLFADRVHQHFFNGGALTPDRVATVFNKWVDILRSPLVAESARWGDAQRASDPYTVPNEWQTEVDRRNNSYIPGRTNTVLNQLRAQNLYPDVEAPTYNQHGGDVPSDFSLTMDAPTGTIYYTLDGTDPRIPAQVSEEVFYLDQGAPATALIPTDATLGDSWQSTTFDDTGWLTGTTGIGFETIPDAYTDLIGLDVGAMQGVNASVYLRVPFTIPDAAALAEIGALTLNMKYEDGFVAYLNGTNIAATDNVPEPPLWNSNASSGHSDSLAVNFVPFTVPPAGIAALQAGENTLAIHLMNSSPGSSDLLAVPQLTATDASAAGISPTAQTYTGPVTLDTPAIANARTLLNGEWSALNRAGFYVGTVPANTSNLVVSEIHYHPASDDSGEEFIELTNIGSAPIDLRGVHFTAGLQFEFQENADTALAALPPGGRIVLVGNATQFASSHPEFRGDLDNGGETITLTDATGTVIQSFTYDDQLPWPEGADGVGYSLVLIAPATAPDHNDPLNWRSSATPGGNPGATDTLTFTGDPDADSDDDGLNAFLEHALGTSDTDPASGRNAINISSDRQITFTTNLAADDTTLTLETSPDLTTWTPANLAITARTNLGNGTILKTYAPPTGSTPRLFIRARATR